MDGSNRWRRWMLAANAGLLIAGALWLRTFSLASLPEHHSDESFYGLQTHRMLDGLTFLSRTTSRNFVSPLLVATQVPFDLTIGPSIYTLRLPVVLAGIAAAVVLFLVARRALDDRTAAMAGLGILALPPAIQFARFGCEYGQTPLVGVVGLGLLWAKRPLALLGWLAFAPLTHPTNLLLLPFLLPLAWVSARREPDRKARRRWMVLGAGMVAVGVGGYLLLRANPNVVGQTTASRTPLAFLDGFAHFLLGSNPPAASDASRWALLAGLVAASAFGLPRLIRERDRPRLAILLGWVGTLVAFDLVAGAGVLADPQLRRYGAVLIMPTVLAASILLESALRPLVTAERGGLRSSGWLAPTAIGWLLLAAAVHFHFGPYLAGNHRLAAFVTDDPFEAATRVIIDELPADPDRRGKDLVIAQDQFINGLQVEYLLSDRPDVQVKPLMTLLEVWEYRNDPAGEALRKRRERLASLLQEGAFAVAIPSSAPERGQGMIESVAADALAPDDLRRWEVSNQVVYRRRNVPEEPIYRVPGTALRPGEAPVAR